MEALEAEHRAGAWGIAPANLAEYGDPRAVGRLGALFDELPEELETPVEDQVVFELAGAIETLGGALTPAQKEREERARRARRAFVEKRRHQRALDVAAKKCQLVADEAPSASPAS
jgi:hypothetical protein